MIILFFEYSCTDSFSEFYLFAKFEYTSIMKSNFENYPNMSGIFRLIYISVQTYAKANENEFIVI